VRWIILIVAASLAAAACSSPNVVEAVPEPAWEIDTGFAASPVAGARRSVAVTDSAIVVNTFFRRNRNEFASYDRTGRIQQWSNDLQAGLQGEI
jgi:hypothetical protein